MLSEAKRRREERRGFYKEMDTFTSSVDRAISQLGVPGEREEGIATLRKLVADVCGVEEEKSNFLIAELLKVSGSSGTLIRAQVGTFLKEIVEDFKSKLSQSQVIAISDWILERLQEQDTCNLFFSSIISLFILFQMIRLFLRNSLSCWKYYARVWAIAYLSTAQKRTII